jgi:hypothetical protein
MAAATCGAARITAADVAEGVRPKLRRGFFARLMESLAETRRLQARREMAKYAHLLAPDHSWREIQ